MKVRHLRPEDLRGKRWAGWLRESTSDQADNVERQRVDVERAATELGMVGPVKWYSRVGSGEAVAMPELAAALAEAGQYDVLVAFHTSRLGRNAAETARVKAEFQKAGIVIYFASQRLISGSFSSALAEGVYGVIDQYDNEVRRMWIAGGLRERMKTGRWTGNIPYGYQRKLEDMPDGSRKWDGALEADPDEYPVFRSMVEEWIAGRSSRDIALRLNAHGHVRRHGSPWLETTVERTMRNPVYLGELHRYRVGRASHYYEATDPGDGRLTVDGRWPALVTPEEHAAMTSPRRAPRSRPRPTFVYPLSNVLRCGACGRAYTGMSNGETRYYRCTGRVQGTGCTAPHVRSEGIEESFARWLDNIVLPDDWRERLARSQMDGPRTDEAARRARLETRLARLRDLYLWGDLSEEAYRAQSADLRAEIAVVAMPNVTSMETVAALLEDVGRTWRMVPAGAQSLLPRALIAHGDVRGGDVEWFARAELRQLLDLCTCVTQASDSVPLLYAV